MERFIVFRGDTYYPGGGWEDFVGSFTSLEAAIEEAKKETGWWHIVDSEKEQICAQS